MRYADFEALALRLWHEVPTEFLEGVSGLEVSRKTLPHPARGDVYTMGECVPLPSEGGEVTGSVQSQVILYYGSFDALARDEQDFDWRGQAWETITHELRHHLEWRARAPDLERFDWAAEQNFARSDGEPFDPTFHLCGDLVAEGVYRLDDAYFIDRTVRGLPARAEFGWHGRSYSVTVPEGLTLPAFLIVEEIEHPPPGELVLVLRREAGLATLFRRPEPPARAVVVARPVER